MRSRQQMVPASPKLNPQTHTKQLPVQSRLELEAHPSQDHLQLQVEVEADATPDASLLLELEVVLEVVVPASPTPMQVTGVMPAAVGLTTTRHLRSRQQLVPYVFVVCP